MKSKVIIAIFLLVSSIASFGQFEESATLKELKTLSDRYLENKNYDSAICVIGYARAEFPEFDKAATYLLDSLYLITRQDSSVLKNLDYGLKKRYFFGLERWAYRDFINNPEFKRLAGIDWQIEDSLNKLTHLEYEIVLPKNYSANKKYPLLFVFHGNSRNIQKEKSVWTSKVTNDKFIVIYVQSYIHLSPRDFRWGENDEKTDREFKEIYEQIVKKYPAEKDKVIFSAMSAGGLIAIGYTFSQFVPVYGLVLNCPVVPDVKDDLVRKFIAGNKKIAIITGENDFMLKSQEDLISKVNKMGGSNRIVINPGLGHDYPENFSSLLDKYLNWVIE